MSVFGKRQREPADYTEEPHLEKRQRTSGTQCPTDQPHTCPGSGVGKTKWYAIWGGPNPGVHLTTWDRARKWAEKCGPVKQRSFKDQQQALTYYNDQKRLFPNLGQSRQTSAPSPLSAWNARTSKSPSQEPLPTSSVQQGASDSMASVVGLASATFETSHAHAGEQNSDPLLQTEENENDTDPLLQKGENLSNTSAHGEEEDYIALEAATTAFEAYQQSNDIVPISEPPLDDEQAKLVALIVSGRRNVFYTGSAGVGKSTVLKIFRRRLNALGKRVDIIAPTGRAALDVNGQTTWTYAGWTPAHHKKTLEELKDIVWQRSVKKRLKRTDVLVIDEISMVENLHLERLNVIMKEVRGNTRPFGGVQLIVTGDFCQLPPVRPFQHCIDCGAELTTIRNGTAYECPKCQRTYEDDDKWAFRSKAWQECNFFHVNLTTVHRQSDGEYIHILNKVRLGKPLLAEERDLLLHHHSETDNAVKLFPLRKDVKHINDAEFAKLTTRARTYTCVDHFQHNPDHTDLRSKGFRADDGTISALREHRYEFHLELKTGMLVVLLTNLAPQQGLVNGSQGTIIAFEAIRTQTDEELDKLDLGLPGEHAVVYREARIIDFMKRSKEKEWPVVKFMNGQVVTIEPSCTVNEYGDSKPYSLLSRTQIPLMAAWAMTVHKSQGMTLNRVEVDLSSSFEEGQAYVALSRARSLEGLHVVAFPESAQMGCNDEVRQFLIEKFGLD